MLKRILSISGRPGLYRLVSQGRNMLIVENLADNKRMPVYARDKVISLGDVSIYSASGSGDTPIAEVYEAIAGLNGAGKPVDIKGLDKEGKLREFFAKAFPDFDDERVNTSDIRKAFQWYNLLVGAGFTTFVEVEEEQQAEPEAETKEESKEEKAEEPEAEKKPAK